MLMTPATAKEVTDVLFQRLRNGEAWKYNWGTAFDNSIWHVGEWTYINGIILHIDFDFEGAWLVEVCDRDPGHTADPTAVRWLAIATGHWPDDIDLRYAWYQSPEPQEFFKRSVSQWDVIQWMVDWYKAIDLEDREGNRGG
jgi:hypothetical protein